MSGIKGWPSQQKLTQATSQNEFVTVIPTGAERFALDSAPRYAFRVGAVRTAGAGTGDPSDKKLGFYVEDTATPARVGDFVRFETGNATSFESSIVAIETNGFWLAIRFDGTDLTAYAPVATDTFYIMRYVSQRVDTDGTSIVTVTPSPMQFVLDGVDTEVEQDTATPGNSIPLPVVLLNPNGTEVTPATETTLSTLNGKVTAVNTGAVTISTALPAGTNNIGDVDVLSLPSLPAGTNNIGDVDVVTLPVAFDAGNSSATTQRVVIATDQAGVATKSPVNANGSVVNTTLTATTASTASAPANAVGFILKAATANTDPIRFAIGTTASTTVGMALEAGRDTGFVPCAANISVCATASGTNLFEIQWILSA